MIELSDRQQQAIAASKQPVRMLDRRTNREYVLVRADVFERMRKALEAEAVRHLTNSKKSPIVPTDCANRQRTA